MRRAFVFDQDKCMACNTCTVACKDWNQVNPGPVRYRAEYTHEYNDSFFPLSMGCNHCKEPACKAACPIGAIEKRDSDGVVFVNRDVCQSLGACVATCPFSAAHIADNEQEPQKIKSWVVSHPMQKCDFCLDRIDKGEQPACVGSCPARALESGDYEYLKQKYAAKGVTLVPLNKADFPYAYSKDNDNTGPSFLIKKRKNLQIIKAK